MRKIDRFALAITITAVFVALSLQVCSIFQQSFTADEPYFLFAGYRAVRFGQNTLNLEHPPLVGMIAALPFAHIASTTDNPYYFVFDNPSQARWIRLSSRTLLFFVFTIPLLWCCVQLGHELTGLRAGMVLMLTMASSFSVLPYLTVVQTDTAESLGYLVTFIVAIRFIKIPSFKRAIGMGLGLGLALATKFSGLLLLPTVFTTVCIGGTAQLSWRKRFGFFCVVIGISGALLHCTYRIANWNYERAIGRETIRRYCTNQGTVVVDDQFLRYEELLLSIERLAPMEAQWLTGVLGVAIQNRIGIYATHALDTTTSQGRWWLFPFLLLIRTPLVLLIAYIGALATLCFRAGTNWWETRTDPIRKSAALVFLVTMGVYSGVAMSSNYNLGIRHLLPIMPFLIFPVAAWVSQRLVYSSTLIGLLLAESIAITPLWMTATNTWWLGEHNPTYCAVISDCEYKQNFLILAQYAREQSLVPLHIAYPLFAEFERKILTPEAVIVDPKAPLTPGWHAVSIYVERFLPIILQTPRDKIHNYDMFANIAREWSSYYAEVRRRGKDYGHVAGTFHLYYISS